MERNGTSAAVVDGSMQCGIGNFRPKFLQQFASITTFVGVFSIASLASQTLTVYVNTQVPNLERQFGLSSAQSGLVMAFNDIGYFAVVLFISATARFVHIPRVLCFCIFLYGVSGLICAFPQLIAVSKGLLPILNLSSVLTKVGEESDKIRFLCRPELNSSDRLCHSERENTHNPIAAPSYSIQTVALLFFGIGLILQGIGKAPRIPFYMVYIDDTIDQSKTGFYAGIATSTSIIGSAVAFLVGGYFSRLYVTLEDVDMTSRDPRWIGAWWLGFVVFGAVSLLTALPLPFFPRHLKISPKDIVEGKLQDKTAKRECSVSYKLKMIARSYGRILRNPVYLLTTGNNIFSVVSLGGWHGFISKYMSTHFNVPLSLANYILAGAVISTGCFGTLIGGFLTRKIKMTPRNVHTLILSTYGLNIIFLAAAMAMSCPQPTIIGPQLKCLLIVPVFPMGGRGDKCSYLIPWSSCIIFGSIPSAIRIAPNFIAVIRSVESRDKAAALGLNSCLLSALGWGLSPILFGKMVDSSCRIWQYPCSSSGACELYDFRLFRLSFHGFPLAMKCIALAFTVSLIMLTRNWQNWKYSHQKECPRNNVDMQYNNIPSEDMELSNKQQNPVENLQTK